MDVRVEIDRDTGEYQTFRRWLIVADEDYTYPDVEKTIEEIQEEIPGTTIQIGEYYERAAAKRRLRPPSSSNCQTNHPATHP